MGKNIVNILGIFFRVQLPSRLKPSCSLHFFILMNDMWQRSNLTIRKTPTQSLYFSNLLSLTSPLLSTNYRHHLSMRDPSMEALFNTRYQMKSNPANQIQYLSLLQIFYPEGQELKRKKKLLRKQLSKSMNINHC